MFGAESAPMPEMKTEPLAMSQMVSCKVGRKEHLFRSGGDLSLDTGRPYKGSVLVSIPVFPNKANCLATLLLILLAMSGIFHIFKMGEQGAFVF